MQTNSTKTKVYNKPKRLKHEDEQEKRGKKWERNSDKRALQ